MSVNHRIEYIPLTKDLNGNHLIYPIYIPINIDEPEIFAATGKLSPHDYKRTLKLLHSRPMFKVDAKGAGQVEEAGFPFAPLIAALAPIVIPGVIKAAKNIFGSKADHMGKKSSKGRLYMGRGDDDTDVDESNVNNSEDNESTTNDSYFDEVDTPEDTDFKLDEEIDTAISKSSETPIGANKTDKSGYIPTNPNINSIKKLQSLYDTYK